MPRQRGPNINIGPGVSAGQQANTLRARKNAGLARGIGQATAGIVSGLNTIVQRREREKDRELRRDLQGASLAQQDAQFQQSMSLRERQVANTEMRAADSLLGKQESQLTSKLQEAQLASLAGQVDPNEVAGLQEQLQQVRQRRQGLATRQARGNLRHAVSS